MRSAIFDAGKTSRINVANLMSDLITDDRIWHKWKGKMPVIYDKEVPFQKTLNSTSDAHIANNSFCYSDSVCP